MKVNYKDNIDYSFKGVLNNKALKKSLEFAADNGTLFAATTTLVLSGVRPLAILSTPNTDKKNKHVACSKSLTSTIVGYLIALLASKPLSNAIKKIDSNPQKYLKSETIKKLKENSSTLTASKAYILSTQLFKLGLGFIIAAPKAVLTALGTPFLLKIFETKKDLKDSSKNFQEDIPFKGKKKLPKCIGKIIDKKSYQDFSKKYKDSNFPMHIIAATDTLSTAVFVRQIATSKKMGKKDKKPLIYNSIISTTLSLLSTYFIDYLTKNQTDKLIEKFKKANKDDPKLSKYIEGIKIAKPIIIAGIVYYVLIPIISTFLADRVKSGKTT